MTSTFRQRLLTSTLFVSAAALSAPAWAQQVPQDDQANQENAVQAVPDPTNATTEANEADTDDGEIIVTGSRIARPDLTSTSPLTVVNDEEFKLSGTVNVEQVINNLPQVIPGATAFSNNPGGGVATLNLRGLGSTRNLVLVNGRRYIFFDAGQVVDANTIPAFLIDSVDVVTGGASAVYGSDALAGVLNFRLRSDLNGFEAGGQMSITERGDGKRYNIYAALGTEFADGRGNVTIFGEYFKREDVFQGERGFSRFALGDDGSGGLTPVGSATTDRGRITAPASAVIPAGNGLPSITLPRGVGNFGTPFGANFGSPGVSDRFDFPGETFNYAPTNFLQVPQKRYSLGGYGEYEISDAVTAYGEVNFINNQVDNELAPTPVTGNTVVGLAGNQANLSAADFAALQRIDANETAINAARAARGLTPLFSGTLAQANLPGFVALGVNRRIVETGSRASLDDRNAFRILGGFKGPAFGDFNYDIYGFYSRTRNANIQEGNISRAAFNAGVLNGTVNVFGPGTISDAAVDAISIVAQNNDISTLKVAQASLAGSLFNLGTGAGDIGLAVGAEYREAAAEFIPDTALSSGDVVGFNAGNATKGDFNVKELFGEIRVPIFDKGFIHSLELNGAYRYSDYSLEAVGGVHTYAAGAQFAPVRDITFRGQYQRAIRAPNVGELFGGQTIGFPAATDPCSSRNTINRTEAVRQRCIASGVPAPLVFTTAIQANNQIQGNFGGNPNLEEEKSDTFTLGAVIRPRFIPRLNITIDAYDIDIEGVVGSAGGGLNNVLDLCFVQGVQQFCDLVRRNPQTGSIEAPFLVTALNINQGKLETRGIDFQVDYSTPLGFSLMNSGRGSKVNFFFLGTYTDQFDITPVAGSDTVIECADKFGNNCGDPRPSYKWTSRLSFIDGPLTLSGRWRHLSSSRDDDDDTEFSVERIKGYNLFDASLSFDIADNFTFATGVNNILDKKPPILGDNAEQANTYPGTYDVLGRDFFASVNVRF